MKIIAITGGIATGKTTVAKILSSFLKAKVIDADKIVHEEILVPQSTVWGKTIRMFGKDFVQKDLHIDRKSLGNLIFKDISKRKKLEQIVHPAVKKNIKEKLKQFKKDRIEWVIMDIPLLFESKMQRMANKIIVVARNKDKQIETLCKTKKMSIKDAKNRIGSQLPLSEKIKYADFTVNNNGSIRETKRQVKEIFFNLKTLNG